jgi:hypothetical protein
MRNDKPRKKSCLSGGNGSAGKKVRVSTKRVTRKRTYGLRGFCLRWGSSVVTEVAFGDDGLPAPALG